MNNGHTTPRQLTPEEYAAFRRLQLATAGEDRNKDGLEHIGRLIDTARANAEKAADEILPEVADTRLRPAPPIHALPVTESGVEPLVTLSKLGDAIFGQLKKEAVLKPDIELLRRSQIIRGETRLETFAGDWLTMLFGWSGDGGLAALMQRKIDLARALGNADAAGKLQRAFSLLAPSFALSDRDGDIKRFAAEIAPDSFYAAFREALKLDADATDALNGGNAESGEPPTVALVPEQAALLQAAARDSKIAAARNKKQLEGAEVGGHVSQATQKAAKRQAALADPDAMPEEAVMQVADRMKERGELVKNIVAYIAEKLNLTESGAKAKWYRHTRAATDNGAPNS